MGWHRSALSEYVDRGEIGVQTGPFGTQLRASDYTEEGVPVINVRNIGYGSLLLDKLEHVPDSVARRLGQHILEPNDIVFGRKGAVDRHIIVGESHAGWMQGSDCIRIRINTPALSPKFVSYAFCLQSHIKWMQNQCSNKATMASLNQDVICRIVINIPDSHTQQRIVEVLSAYDDLIENSRRRIQLLEQAAQLLYQEWFVRLRFPGHEHAKIKDGIPEGWADTCLPEIIDVNPQTPCEKGKEIWYVPMSALSESGMTVDLSQLERRTDHTSVKFKKDDVLLARITPCLENGKTGLSYFLAEDEVACGSTEFIVLRGKKVSPAYTYCLARSYSLRGVAIKSMIGASGRQRVQTSCFCDFKAPLPPQHILDMFDEIAGKQFNQIRILMAQQDLLVRARDLLLPRLMSGEVAV